jgi:hypothetical protein
VCSSDLKKTPSLDGEKSNCTYESEILLATSKTPFVQLGLGVNTEYKNHSSKSGFAIELYKDFKIGKKFNALAEYRYNSRAKGSTAYIKMGYKF